MIEAAIGVFDSGVGGLSVLREIRKILPGEDLYYVADSGAAPYGDRSEQFIHNRVHAIVEFLMSKHVKAVVVACNTATAIAVQALRARYSIPIIAMEPAVKPAVKLTRSGVIGVMATSRTLASESFKRLADHHGDGVQIILQPCPGFVEQVEKGQLDDDETRVLVQRYVSSLIAHNVDTIVLGCTHYPFLTPVIKEVAGDDVVVIDPSAAVARQVFRRLESSGLLAERDRPGKMSFWTSGVPDQVAPVISKLWGQQIEVQAFPYLSDIASK